MMLSRAALPRLAVLEQPEMPHNRPHLRPSQRVALIHRVVYHLAHKVVFLAGGVVEYVLLVATEDDYERQLHFVTP